MDSIKFILDMLFSIPSFEDFYLKNSQTKDFDSLISLFKQRLIESNSLDYETDLTLKIVKEKYALFVEKNGNAISFLNENKKIEDNQILAEFNSDFKKCNTAEIEFRNAEKQHYKTITERIAFHKINFTPEIIEKYLYIFHPYICSNIAIAFTNAKLYDVGLTFLQKSLFNVFSYPNIYWDNPNAIYGCADALYEFQHLLGQNGMLALNKYIPNARRHILTLLFLYLSRAIHIQDTVINEYLKHPDKNNIPNSLIQKINYLSSRADLIYDYREDFAMIFGLGVNPDIQFIADKATAHYLSTQVGLEIMTMQCWKDSLKMYQYGSLIPNYTGGYKEIEDETWDKLIERGNSRSIQIANNYLSDFNKGIFSISKPIIADSISFLKDMLEYDLEYAIAESDKRYSFEKIRTEYWIQQLTFPQKNAVDFFVKKLQTYKIDYKLIEQYLLINQVKYFFHFTDRSNLDSIKKYGALYSWKYCETHSIDIPMQGGNELSKELDSKSHLEDYVRLSFCDDHPMIWRLKMGGYNLVLLKIKIDVAFAKDTLFTDINATDNNCNYGNTFEHLQKVNIQATKQHYINGDSSLFKKHQAEILVKSAIPIDYILNLNDPISL